MTKWRLKFGGEAFVCENGHLNDQVATKIGPRAGLAASPPGGRAKGCREERRRRAKEERARRKGAGKAEGPKGDGLGGRSTPRVREGNDLG